MSRGLGWLQVEILATLEEAKGFYRSYCGGHWDVPTWSYPRGGRVLLADGMYDLRTSCKYLARKHGRLQACPAFISEVFQSAFSRAVRTLVSRGKLRPLSLVPLVEAENAATDNGPVLQLSDGLFLNATGRQARFVSVMNGCGNAP